MYRKGVRGQDKIFRYFKTALSRTRPDRQRIKHALVGGFLQSIYLV